MNIDEIIKTSRDIDLHEISDEGKIRNPGGILALVIFIIGLIWSLFHFYTAGFGLLTATLQRSAHLSIGLALCFLYFPFNRKKEVAYHKIPWHDILLALTGFMTIIYTFVFYNDLVWRVGMPNQIDLLVGGLAIILVLLAAHRAFGPALPIVTIVFLFYPFVGQYLPEIIGHGGYRMVRVINDLYLTNTGIFGIPIGVSSTFVFTFVLFGCFFQASGAAQYIVQLSFAAMGRFKGGPAKAAVVASGFMGSIAGSSVANTVVTGSITIPMMKKTGFSSEVAGGVETAASTDGQFLPPIMGAAAFVMAEFTGIPYWQICIAAALPAIISYAALLCIVHLQAAKTGMQAMPKAQIPPLLTTFIKGIFYWFPICILVYYLIIRRFTPNTAGFYAILAVIGMMIVMRAIKLGQDSKKEEISFAANLVTHLKGLGHDILQALDSTARSMAGIAVACACAGIIVGVVTLTGLGMSITQVIATAAGDNLFILLIMAAAISIILGLGLPTTAKYVIMATLVAPAILMVEPTLPVVGVHLFILYYAILADDTPPVGVAAYAAAAIARSDPIRTGLLGFKFDLGAFLLPFMFIYNPEFLLIDTTWQKALMVASTSLFGIYCFSAVIQRWLFTQLKIWEQVILLAIAFSMIWPTWITDIVGASVFIFIYLHQRAVKKREDETQNLSAGA
ncbi:TRAP transporter permease [Dethiobacter alkaliphilus]|uniref:TRAP transporter, 4TM/12TM fusion protein n=1 Tax=Dethiobacter alkaliphilus AHT 1 TaxID=555088 RepID=C0GKX8_DETAL|nr:TRAP transporter permease [Dethiobacter alkaliphilus]EEG76008.1 TRAP transporter, 4TM/12TM fusion protein [Dethiobacter alkaliphilus AHT 1]